MNLFANWVATNPRQRDRFVGWFLFGAALVALLVAERSVGFPRDESVYFEAGRSYAHWWVLLFQKPLTALSDSSIQQYFAFNNEHPALMKTLFGWSHLIFHERLHWLRPATAYRLPALAVTAMVLPVTYFLGREVFDRRVGAFAAISFLLVPRQLFNGVLACFDMPVAAFWLLTIYCFVRAQRETRYVFWTGGAFALALCTKHNALFLPFVLAPFSIWATWRASRNTDPRQPPDQTPEARSWALSLLYLTVGVGLSYLLLLALQGSEGFARRFHLLSPQLSLFVIFSVGASTILYRLYRVSEDSFRAAAPLFAIAIFGPIAFYLHWPHLWHHPVDRTASYLAFHARHEHYAWFYLGTLLRSPPFPLSYVVVKTALTVPLSLFVPMAAGFVGLLGKNIARGAKASWNDCLLLANAIVPIAIISHPQVPHFGGVKHWLPAMPFLALFAGVVLREATAALITRWPHRGPARSGWVFAALGTVICLSALIATVRVHPYGTAFYGELAGGTPGAASLGMQRQFWSSHVTAVLPWLNENAPPRSRVYFHEVIRWGPQHYKDNGMLRADIIPAPSPEAADFVVYQYHQEFREQEMNTWQAFQTQTPVAGLYLDETPQIIVYQRNQ